MKNHQPTVKPSIELLPDILSQIENGELLVPNFQRPFVWKPEAMISLFDSIYNGYPIGSLLFWTTTSIHRTLDKIGPYSIKNNLKENVPISYILDGHQRLSTLYGVLKALNIDENIETEKGDDWKWLIYFDLKTEKFSHFKPNTKIPTHFFPLRKILKTVDFLNQTRTILDTTAEKAIKHIEKAERLVSIIKSYRIPITEIKGGDLGQAVDIFARLNSEGQKMSTDMMYSALTYSETEEGSFNFSERISEIKDRLYEYNFGEVDRMLIFRSVLAAAGKDIYIKIKGKSNIDLLREIIVKDELPAVVNACEESIIKATRFFSETIKIPNQRFLPYYLQFIIFSEFFRLCPNPSQFKLKRMEQWFWVSSFTGIETVNNSLKNSTLKEVQDFASTTEEEALRFEFKAINFSDKAIELPETFNLNSSRVQAFILFLTSLEPISIINNENIDIQKVLSQYGNKAFSQIVPTKKWNMHIANRVILENPKYRPKVCSYLIQNKDSLMMLKSQAISSKSIEGLMNEKYSVFLKERYEDLAEAESQFMDSKGVESSYKTNRQS
jgi:hypothetical protein